jgi:hypothetical protein
MRIHLGRLSLLEGLFEPKDLSSYGNTEIPLFDLLQAFYNLDDISLVESSIDYSNYFAMSIGRWAARRDQLIESRISHGECISADGKVLSMSAFYFIHVAHIGYGTTILQCLTVGDIETLAQLETPTVTNPDQIGNHIARDVDIGIGSLPHDRYSASLAAEASLFFVLVYFLVYTKEARRSVHYPVDGTLFADSRFLIFLEIKADCFHPLPQEKCLVSTCATE